MGQGCTKETAPSIVHFNPDDPIDEVHTIPKACAPTGAGFQYMSHLLPNNGEYTWAGEGEDCHYCSNEAPRETKCSSCDGASCCPMWGKKGLYKRISYEADPVQCCILKVKNIKDKTCDPKYLNPNSESCFLAKKKYCNKNPFRLWNDPICQNWCANNYVECQMEKAAFCNDPKNIDNVECLNWCAADPGKCDVSMKEYCEKVPMDYRCACIRSPLIEHNHNPLCDDRKCIDFGYATSSQLISRGEGCRIVDCKTYFDIKSKGKVTFDDVTIKDRCDSENSKITPPMVESLEKPSLSHNTQQKKTLIAVIIVIIIIFLFLLLLFLKP